MASVNSVSHLAACTSRIWRRSVSSPEPVHSIVTFIKSAVSSCTRVARGPRRPVRGCEHNRVGPDDDLAQFPLRVSGKELVLGFVSYGAFTSGKAIWTRTVKSKSLKGRRERVLFDAVARFAGARHWSLTRQQIVQRSPTDADFHLTTVDEIDRARQPYSVSPCMRDQ
jgi:hypothetical protein